MFLQTNLAKKTCAPFATRSGYILLRETSLLSEPLADMCSAELVSNTRSSLTTGIALRAGGISASWLLSRMIWLLLTSRWWFCHRAPRGGLGRWEVGEFESRVKLWNSSSQDPRPRWRNFLSIARKKLMSVIMWVNYDLRVRLWDSWLQDPRQDKLLQDARWR